MSDNKTLRIDPQRLALLTRRIAEQRPTTIHRAREEATRILTREAERNAVTQSAIGGGVRISAARLAQAITQRYGIPLDKAQIIAMRALDRRMSDEAANPPAPGPVSEELEQPWETTARELSKTEGLSLPQARAEVMKAFKGARRKTLPTVASEPANAPPTGPARPTPSATMAPTGIVPATARISVRRLARHIAATKGISLELAQQMADRHVRAARGGKGGR